MIAKKRVEEQKNIAKTGFSKAIEILSEARELGMIGEVEDTIYKESKEIISIFQNIVNNWNPLIMPEIVKSRLDALQAKFEEKRVELIELEETIDNAKEHIGYVSNYNSEISHQKIRLESIGLFEKLNFENNKCPFCSSDIKNKHFGIDMLKKSVINLDIAISNIEKERPQLSDFIKNMEKERIEKKENIKVIQNEIIGIYNQIEEAKKIGDVNIRCGTIKGKMALWLDSVDGSIKSAKGVNEISELENKLSNLNNLLDKEQVEEKKNAALSIINQDMNNYVKELKLEYSNCPYRLNLKNLTVVIDTLERSIPLKEIGSGANWLGIHLITYFSLQKFFINMKRPVPQFLFLDQPSQVYFPSEKSGKSEDLEKVLELYRFIVSKTDELEGKLQTIVVEHAILEDEIFQNNITENWHSVNNNLIPVEWYTK